MNNDKQLTTAPQLSTAPNTQAEVGSVLSLIAKVANDPSLDVNKLEKLLEMQERVLLRNAEIAFNADMALLQPELPPIHKSKKAHNSSYAPYDEIDETIRPLYTKYGFSLSFNSRKSGNSITYYGTVSHRAGHSKTAEIELPADKSGNKNDIQAVASSVTYAKRYLVGMLFNIITTEQRDDDGNGANGYISEDQKSQIIQLMKETSADTKRFLDFMGIETLDMMPSRDFVKAKNALAAKRKKS